MSPEEATHGTADMRAEWQASYDKLTEREAQVLVAVCKGFGYKEAAALLGIGHSTVNTHMDRALRKMGGIRAIEAAVILAKLGLV